MDDFDVVADSEGEELGFGQPKARRVLSSIETAETGDSGLQRISPIDTTSLGASLTATGLQGYHGQDAPTSAGISDVDFPNVLSIADRAKTRQRNARQSSLPTPGSSTRVPHPFDDGNDLFDADHVRNTFNGDSEDDYTGPRSRPKPRPKKKKSIETWDDSELLPGTRISYGPSALSPMQTIPMYRIAPSPPPPPRARPKPRPIKRGQKSAGVLSDKPGEINQEQQPTSQLSIPVPTSPLPPSDPPVPTSTGQYADVLNEPSGSMPPIVTLAHPASSPSSLFSAVDRDNAHIPDLEDDPLLLGPPSTFFTGSSSPDQVAPLPPPPAKSRATAIEEIEVIDLCTVPPRATEVQILSVKKAPTSKKGKEKEKPSEKDIQDSAKGKGKAKGKRKARDEDEFGPDMDDDDDDEYDDGKRKKAKAKVAEEKGTRKKPPKSKKKIPEVIIDAPRNTTKSKGKEKDSLMVSPGLEDDIPRGDDMIDQVTRPSTPRNLKKAPGTPPRPIIEGNHLREPETPLSSVPDSEGEDMLNVDVAGSGKMTAVLTSGVNKRRRKGVIYDEEDETWEREEGGSSATKRARIKRGTQANGKKMDGAQAEPKKKTQRERGKGRRVMDSDSEEDGIHETGKKVPERKPRTKAPRILSDEEDEGGGDESVKENVQPQGSGYTSSSSRPRPPPPKHSPTNDTNNGVNAKPASTSLTSGYTIAPKTKSTPMSELIKRVNSLPHSPSYSPLAGKDKDKSAVAYPGVRLTSVTAYSPYFKTSRSFLSKIAPLHPNRRTPPPPLPPPPPRKKSKKELEREEQWEEELIESVGGPAAWSCLSEEERKGMRRAKWAMERGEVDV
ncbi:hypothetical protein AX15_001046 [Amanita polypyramis BW_CC]|nr:hypothetical protein AX15_001046 [Amanita polypyramis BW_CC]